MKEAPGNPETNKLQAGITDKKLADAVSRSGYPLQIRVAFELQSQFTISEEWGYIDRETKTPRALDIHAYRSLLIEATSQFHPELTLLVECKRSELPFTFFSSAIQAVPRDFPSLTAFRRARFELHMPSEGYQEVVPSVFLSLRDFPFVSGVAPVSRAFVKAARSGSNLKVAVDDVPASADREPTNEVSRTDLSGEVPYRALILPLASALQHWEGLRRVEHDQPRYFPSLALALCVLDAPMVLVTGDPQHPELTMQPWVRVVRQEAFQGARSIAYRHYVVDCVHIDYFRTFVDSHVMPFAQAVATRIEEGKQLLTAGRGLVSNRKNWTWTDLKPVPS